MGAAASAASVPLPAAEAAIPADPPAKEEPQRSVADASPPAGDAGAAGCAGGGGATSAEEAGETVIVDVAAEGKEAEEEGECGFCLFMKGGGCKEEFVGWEKCVEEAEEADVDVVERCYEVTASLRKCMDAHAEYYEPILRAERAMAEDLDAAKVREAAETSSQPAPPPEEESAGKNQAVVPEKEDAAA
ncbi:hypothetical protein GUJ93_ZPchr0013g37375 [Zizania palustris]|uniref:GCK domain-containing protein n=1 Tax=Zizania palustris TaxID=103762 RepID=A0A8J5WYW0_ZIZPA|nr:hypothetical protein GUJ93_ZPchr0013g37375 [Zizania palustris]